MQFSVENLSVLLNRVFYIILIVILTVIVYKILIIALEKALLSKKGAKKPRSLTAFSLLRSLIQYLLFFIAGVMILQVLGIDATTIIASAGILGLAISLGAQSIVRDVIAGFFIVFEDQFEVGDKIKIDEVEGEVVEIKLRTTILRDEQGSLHVIPNGAITKITKFKLPAKNCP